MGVDTDFGALVQDVAVCTNTIRDVVHHQTSTRVGDVDAVRAIRFHQLACLASSSAGVMWLIIRKPETSMPISRAVSMCCAETSASVQCVATRNRANTEVVSMLEFTDRADTRKQQRGETSVLEYLGRCFDPFPVGVRAGAVVERAAGEAVTVRNFDRVDAGSVESCDDPLDVGRRDAVANSVHAVAKGDVLDEDLAVAHLVASFCWAMRSAICIPADVMMSRLPAYAGR